MEFITRMTTTMRSNFVLKMRDIYLSKFTQNILQEDKMEIRNN